MTLPASLTDNPRLDRWIAFLPDRTARVASGKVEIGQGVVTALRQIAAEELNLPLGRVAVASGDTDIGPDEQYTTSSLSIMVSGGSIRLAAAEARALLTEQAALRLNCAPSDLAVLDGAFHRAGEASGIDYWDVAGEIDWSRAPTGAVPTKPISSYDIVGQDTPRDDLPAKVFGGGFLHDMAPEGVVHARILRQPLPGAELIQLDERAVRRAAKGEVEIVRRANFVAFLATDEWSVEQAAATAPAYAQWEGGVAHPANADPRALPGQPAVELSYGDAAQGQQPAGDTVEVSITRPYVAHASLGPSVALARFEDGKLEIRSHGQGMHPLRRNIAAALDLPEASIHAVHVDGPGCYGHNGADDAALDAAVIALERPGRWIRVQWRREEEFAYEPVGPAMLVKIAAVVDDVGLPVDWTTDVWSPVHVQRPGAPGVVMLGAQALRPMPPWGPPSDPPEARGFGGPRNAFPLYNVGQRRIRHHLTERAPIRTSALRGLGALPNVYAIESLMDVLAGKAGQDAVAYRLALLEDSRARAVLERTAALADWPSKGAGGDGKGLGIAFARYKNIAAYAAVAVAVTVDEEVRLDQIWTVADAGLAINPNGIRNQLEGGCVQGASWALKEAVQVEGNVITSLDWDTYPILRFSDVPDIHAELIENRDDPALGVGECTVGPTAAAIGNAVAYALGRRIDDMPLTRDRVMATLLAE
ncbi:MAG: molybdopterin cofactor-binding domain-containing protein [Alphaproteobacteria bacterium]